MTAVFKAGKVVVVADGSGPKNKRWEYVMDSREITDKLDSLRDVVDSQADLMNDIVNDATQRRRTLEALEERAENARTSLQSSLDALESISDELDEARQVIDRAEEEGIPT